MYNFMQGRIPGEAPLSMERRPFSLFLLTISRVVPQVPARHTTAAKAQAFRSNTLGQTDGLQVFATVRVR